MKRYAIVVTNTGSTVWIGSASDPAAACAMAARQGGILTGPFVPAHRFQIEHGDSREVLELTVYEVPPDLGATWSLDTIDAWSDLLHEDWIIAPFCAATD